MIFYKHYIGDYQRDTGHLTMTEDCAFRRLLDTYYATERPLPADVETLYRHAKASSKAERDAVATVAAQFFPVAPDGLRHHKRCDAEIFQKQDKSAKARKSAVAKYNKEHNCDTPCDGSCGGICDGRCVRISGRIQSADANQSQSQTQNQEKEKELTGPTAEGEDNLSAPQRPVGPPNRVVREGEQPPVQLVKDVA